MLSQPFPKIHRLRLRGHFPDLQDYYYSNHLHYFHFISNHIIKNYFNQISHIIEDRRNF